jgi:hypothetical protein
VFCILDASKHSEKTNKRTWFTPLEDLPDDHMNNIEFMKTKAYEESEYSTPVASSENPLIAPGNTQGTKNCL